MQGFGVRHKKISAMGSVYAILSCLFVLLFSLPLQNAYAQVIVQRPVPADTPIRDPLEIRQSHPITGDRRPHRGIDYAIAQGTSITTVSPVTCHSNPGGWGTYARANLGCGVQLLYAHLSQCQGGTTTVLSGGARGTPGAGGSTGPHLHLELTINGCTVDPEVAYGQDLCLGATKESLYADARTKLAEFATCGAPATDQTNTQPPPIDPNTGEQSVTEVPTGGINPATGMINLGPPYVYVIQHDGRVRIEPITHGEDNEYPPLEPTTDDLVQEGNQGGTPSSCSADTWAEMVNQSVLMVRREMIMNQTIVTKPDSILAYSCFYDFARHAGETLGTFSEAQDWVNRQVEVGFGESRLITLNAELSTDSLDGAINIGAINAYENFMLGQFNHAFLGGQLRPDMELDFTDEHADAGPQAYQPCGVMNAVWDAAREMDANDITPNLFPDFAELIEPDSDPRIYPQNMSCMNTGITQNMIDIANGAQTEFSTAGAAMNAAAAAPENECGRTFYTGVTVIRRQGAGIIANNVESPDGFCEFSNCTFRDGACSPWEAP